MILMEKLIKGLHKFQTEIFPIQKDFFKDLIKGQSPEILFISCADSRINPQQVTSADPGDLFILRNAGNIIPVYTNSCSGEAATIEFAVAELRVKHIIMCGHSHCGALDAVFDIDNKKHQPSLQMWIRNNIGLTLALVRQNYQNINRQELLNILLQEHVLRQLENLKTHPVVMKAINEHALTLHAWIYKFEEGDIVAFNPQNGQFERIKHF